MPRIRSRRVSSRRFGSTASKSLPAGARVVGEVAAVQDAGKVKGRASLAMRFTRVMAGDESYPISAPFAMTAPSTKKQDAQKIGMPAAGGAIIGAIIGGKKGAAIGAAVGGGAGTAHVLMTEGKDVALGTGATIAVTLQQPMDVKVPIRRDAVNEDTWTRTRLESFELALTVMAWSKPRPAYSPLAAQPPAPPAARATPSARRPGECPRRRDTGRSMGVRYCAQPSSGRAIHD